MGTNYYWYPKPACECCGNTFDEIHIGKSSGGWCFSLHVIPEDNINTLNDWVNKWNEIGVGIIKDEYGENCTPEDMYLIITARSYIPKSQLEPDWYQMNQAEPGPNGLARAKIDGLHCIGHGEGTWDYIQGEFS